MEETMDINGQKYIRTGDVIKSKKDDKKRVVHYVVDFADQLSFDEPMSRIKKLLVYNGVELETILPKDLIIN
jgi:hypothetical protein